MGGVTLFSMKQCQNTNLVPAPRLCMSLYLVTLDGASSDGGEEEKGGGRGRGSREGRRKGSKLSKSGQLTYVYIYELHVHAMMMVRCGVVCSS